EHAAALAANEEAERYCDQAAELTDDPVERAALFERTGQMAYAAGDLDTATTAFERAIELFETAGQSHPAARVSARLGEITWQHGHLDQAVERMERSLEVLSEDRPDEDLAWLTAQLGRFHYFMGESDRSALRLE